MKLRKAYTVLMNTANIQLSYCFGKIPSKPDIILWELLKPCRRGYLLGSGASRDVCLNCSELSRPGTDVEHGLRFLKMAQPISGTEVARYSFLDILIYISK